MIDLLLVDPKERRCLILDWKTNRITPKALDELAARYLSQLAAYWKAISTMTGFEVQAGLYSTAAGGLHFYPAAELEERWTRLHKLDAEGFHGEIDPPLSERLGGI